MKDDFQIPNLGTMPEKYDQSYFRRLARNIEQTFTALRAKGSIQVSDLTADNVTAGNVTLTNPLPIVSGGTGAPDAAGARTNLDAQQQWPNLDAIGPLASAADTMPYFTGSGTAALTPITSYGRSLLSAASGWKPIYNQYSTGVSNVAISIVGAKMVRFHVYAIPVSGSEQSINMYLSNNNGSTWDTTAASYGQAMDYSGGAVGGPGTSTPGSAPSYPASSTQWTLSCHSVVRPSSVSLFGFRGEGTLSGMLQSYTVMNAYGTSLRGSGYNDVLIGQMSGWKGGFAANAFLIQVASGLMNIDLFVEALY